MKGTGVDKEEWGVEVYRRFRKSGNLDGKNLKGRSLVAKLCDYKLRFFLDLLPPTLFLAVRFPF